MFRWKNEIGIEGKLQFRVSLNWIFVLGGQLSTSHMPLSNACCFLASWPCSFGMLRCLFKSGAGQGTGSWQCRAGWMLTPGSRVSDKCPCHGHTFAVLVHSQLDVQLELRVIFFHPFSVCQLRDNAGYAKTGQPLTDTKAQQNVAHFWWALAATCNIFLGGDQLG